jgi:glycine cleavage system H protein
MSSSAKPADNLKYAASHEWARLDADGSITIGITDHAQEALGDVVFLELPEIGRVVKAGESVAVIESVKAASDIYAPVSGEVIARNDAAVDAPESVNADAYATWLFKIKPVDASELNKLLDAAAYHATL